MVMPLFPLISASIASHGPELVRCELFGSFIMFVNDIRLFHAFLELEKLS